MKNISKIFRFTSGFSRWYVVVSAFIIVGSLLNFVTPFVLKQMVDVITGELTGKGVNITSIYWSLSMLFAADVLGSVVAAYSMWLGDLLAVKLQTFLSYSSWVILWILLFFLHLLL